MKRYQIIGSIMLSFIVDDEQADFLISKGILESDEVTVWYTKETGERFESITQAHIIDVCLEKGLIKSEGPVSDLLG